VYVLWSAKFDGANEEYLKAHEHYRHRRNKECLTECLTECLKAFESTMKIICLVITYLRKPSLVLLGFYFAKLRA
jgi:hypothetical protein